MGAPPPYNPERQRRADLRRRYGITPEIYDDMYHAQGGLCGLCGVAPIAHIDHDHDTGLVRKLLCHNCNVGLGHFRDDPVLLQTAVDYLVEHGAKK